MAQLKLNPTDTVADAIRAQASRLGVSTNAYLAPFLQAIAEGRLTMEVHFPTPTKQHA